MAKADLTAQRLREVLEYESDTGVFRWRLRLGGRTSAGTIAGVVNASGYVTIGVDGTKHYAHRLAWLYMTGQQPRQHIDHINGEKSDNRFSNLRDVSRSTNLQNMRKAMGREGLIGASLDPRGGWQSGIRINGKRVALGRFATAEEAHAAYIRAKRKHHAGCTI